MHVKCRFSYCFPFLKKESDIYNTVSLVDDRGLIDRQCLKIHLITAVGVDGVKTIARFEGMFTALNLLAMTVSLVVLIRKTNCLMRRRSKRKGMLLQNCL